jgi:hypothetical protein
MAFFCGYKDIEKNRCRLPVAGYDLTVEWLFPSMHIPAPKEPWEQGRALLKQMH